MMSEFIIIFLYTLAGLAPWQPCQLGTLEKYYYFLTWPGWLFAKHTQPRIYITSIPGIIRSVV